VTITSQRTTGNKGEAAVVDLLLKNGYQILERNFTVRQGEIDIIAQKEKTVAFVEVKTRKNRYFALSQIITPSKQHKIIVAAKQYLQKQKYIDYLFRFDVALVTEGAHYNIEYLPNAFQEQSYY
jgi:putative endonuclease